MVLGGQARKAIRSVVVYDKRLKQVSEMLVVFSLTYKFREGTTLI